MSSHAVYAPSSAARWTRCTASAEAIARLPEQEEGEAAAKGTEAHEELERVLKKFEGDGMGLWLENDKYLQVDADHPSAYAVALAVDYIRQLPPGRLWVEQRVELTKDIWGRCDVAHFADGTLTIVDLKDGFVGVDAEENEQLMIYAAASILTHNIDAQYVRLVIVQPNDWRPVPRVKQWPTTRDALFATVGEWAAIPKGPQTFKAGEHCRYCPLFGRCEPTRDLLAHLSTAMQHTPDEVPLAQRAVFNTLRKPLEDWFKNADKIWTKDALAGKVPDGMKLVATTKHKAWKDEAAAKKELINSFGKDAVSPADYEAIVRGEFNMVSTASIKAFYDAGYDALELPTPAQAEKLGLDVTDLCERPEGGPALAMASDRRAAWAPKSAAEMFKNVPGVVS